MNLKQMLDVPPVWLVGFLGLSYSVATLWPVRVAWLSTLGLWLAGLGLALLLVAALQMLRRRTTVNPHGQPSVLVTDRLFRASRNPIYLADVLVLGGLTLWWDGLVAVLLVPLFVAVITRRFIRPEEERLRAAFGAAADAYMARTRRWL